MWAQSTMYTINEELRKNNNVLSVFSHMHTIILDSVRDMNSSIFGVPVLLSFIGGYIADVVIVTYYHILFGGLFLKYKKNPTIAILNNTLKLIDIFLLYGICSSTEKEVCMSTAIIFKRRYLLFQFVLTIIFN